jgi:hypothetical protein
MKDAAELVLFFCCPEKKPSNVSRAKLLVHMRNSHAEDGGDVMCWSQYGSLRGHFRNDRTQIIVMVKTALDQAK